MLTRSEGISIGLVLVLAGLLLSACGDEEAIEDVNGAPVAHPVLGELEDVVLDDEGVLQSEVPEALAEQMASMSSAVARAASPAELVVDYPLDGSVFPPEFIAPTFLWHDPDPDSEIWLIRIDFSNESAKSISALTRGAPPPKGEIDLEAIGETNEIYEGTEYQNSAVSWTPTDGLWREIKRRSSDALATITFSGFDAADLGTARTRGSVSIKTSRDPVGAPIFYRDVPMMAAVGKQGHIQPLGPDALPLIAWRLRVVSRRDTKLVLKGMPSCGNCHSFSRDGKTLGMDIDGPSGDKGMYALKSVAKKMVIGSDDVITWNSFPDKPEGHKTIGFGSRVSPDGRFVATTVNESLYVRNFVDHRFLQVFYPTRGILAYYSRADDTIRALAGADDPEFVHCNPVWSPEGRDLVFSRARAFDPYGEGQKPAMYPNDPNEPQIKYDLYRIPFNEGKGGTPIPVKGASSNGMSNTFPKVSPDGKWIVYTKCKNGLLMRPDGRLWIVPFEGGEAREMRCNTPLMNSWHSFSPNGRWLVFSSKSRTPYTQAFLTHIDEDGNDTPAILVPNCTAANRAVNLPEFMNAGYEDLDEISVPVVDHHTHLMASEIHSKAGRFKEAVASLEQALEIEPTFVRALIPLSYALMRLGRHKAALMHLERALSLDPNNLYGHFNNEVCYRRLGYPYMAIRSLERLLEVAPGFPAAIGDLKLAREAAGQLERTIEDLERRVAKAPKDGQANYSLAEAYGRAGRIEDSLKHMTRAVDLNPGDPGTLVQLAWLLSTCPEDGIRDGRRAVALATRAVNLTGGQQPVPLAILAAAMGEVGRHAEAVRLSEKALAMASENSPGLAAEIEAQLKLHRSQMPVRWIRTR
jgi:tetratricopeptide (TPR) repeat protein